MKPEGSWYGPLAGVLCAALLAAASLLFVSMLGTAIGPFRFADVLRDGGRGTQRIGVWIPASSRALVDAVPGDDWRVALAGGLQVVEASTLAELRAAGTDPIAVSDARALDADELDSLLAHVRAGGSILLAGWIAVRDAHGRELGTGSMARLLDVERIATLRSSALVAGTRGPLVAGVERGRRIELPDTRLVPALAGAGELCWAPTGTAAPSAPCDALRLRRLGRGSIVWIATLSSAAASDTSWSTLHRNMLAATLRQPVHEIVAGPDAVPNANATRADIRTQLESITEHRMRLRVTNLGVHAARGIVVRIYANRPLRDASAHSSTLFTDPPALTRGAEHLDLRLPAITSGESRTYIVDIS